MPIFIYNTLSRKKEEFKPINPGHIGMYVCGPTVYDEPHIGHARSAYTFDVIRRYLAYCGFKVKFVRNVTDVDDKIINKAKEEYPGEDLNSAVEKVSEKYLKAYHEDMKALDIKAPTEEPRATRYIKEMVKFIDELIKRGVAYQSGGDVYFDIKKAKNYGKLSHQNLENMEAGARVAPGEKKNDPLDFALWKAAKPDEPSWDSPWGKGRPGWHIECSVMSFKILGDVFDIHGGGLDLIFPHHENEIAQSEGAGKKFAKIWIHHGLLTINSEKMAKSLGNYITIKDFIGKHHPDVLKIFYLQAHYSKSIDFSENRIHEKTQQYKSFVYLFQLYKDAKAKNLSSKLIEKDKQDIEEYKQKFTEAMDDDFGTPQALAALERLKSYARSLADNDGLNKNWGKFKYAVDMLRDLMSEIFNLHPGEADTVNDLRLINNDLRNTVLEAIKDTKFINDMVHKREELKKDKKYTEADKIRKDLEAKGIILEDRKDGTTGWKWK